MIDPARPGDHGIDDAPRQSSLSRQMQQLLEWERALYEAHTKAEWEAAAHDESRSTTTSDGEAEPEWATAPPSAGPAEPGHDTASLREASAHSPAATTSALPGTPVAVAATAPSGADVPTIGPAPRTTGFATSPARSGPSAAAPTPPTPPPPTPEASATRELPQAGFYEKDGEVRLWMRDASAEGTRLARLLPSLRRSVARLGLRLSAFTLNGRLVFEEDESSARSRPEVGRPDAGRIDDRY